MDEYIKREDALNALLDEMVGTGYQSRAMGAIKFIPTADVVPKSEEGAECPICHGTGRIGTTNWLTKNMTKKQIAEEKAKAIAEHEQHIKADVAREIFEDIQSNLPNDFPFLGTAVAVYLDELKKKYTEGGSNG